MNRSIIVAIIIAIGVSVWIGSGVLETMNDPEPVPKSVNQTRKAANGAATVQVKASTVEEITDRLLINGRTESFRKVALRAEVEGRVEKILAERGRHVKKGEKLLKFRTEDREAKVRQARKTVDQRQMEFDVAESLTGEGFNSKVRLATATADLEAARAALTAAEIELDNIWVKAPYDGVFDDRMVELGDYLKVGDEVGTIVDLNPMKVVAFVSEARILDIALGQDAAVSLPDGTSAVGKVTYISSVADQQTRTFKVEIEIPNSGYKIFEGLTANISIDAKHRMAHKISPAILALNDQGTVGVKTVNSDNVVEFYKVDILVNNDKGMWVGGLPDQANIITVGQEFVLVGDKVKPKFVGATSEPETKEETLIP